MINHKDVEFAIIQSKENVDPVSKQTVILEFVAIILDKIYKAANRGINAKYKQLEDKVSRLWEEITADYFSRYLFPIMRIISECKMQSGILRHFNPLT